VEYGSVLQHLQFAVVEAHVPCKLYPEELDSLGVAFCVAV
jgi:hypothetical protein